MSSRKSGFPDNEEKSLQVGRAAGYCWVRNPGGAGRCTRPPGHDGQHIDHNNGRRSLTDTSGWTWA
jgi:hypothetical protein